MTAPEEVAWIGYGWRCWRVTPAGLLLNPWQNSGHQFVWKPATVHVADCFWRLNEAQGRRGGFRCSELVGPHCSCGIRSMTTLPLLATWMARDRQLDRHPAKATVVGRIEIGGKVQRQIPGLTQKPGYQRSEFARIVGPLFVSPLGAEHYGRLRARYGRWPLVVHGPGPETVGMSQQHWLTSLAAAVEAAA